MAICPYCEKEIHGDNLIREILKQISKSNDVDIAYPHTQVLLPEKKSIII